MALIVGLCVFLASATLLTACDQGKPATEGVQYEIVGNEVQVVGYTGTDKHVRIAEKVGPFYVRTIAEEAFKSCNGIKSVEIPDSVESIGKNAFQYCENLTGVAIGNGVKTIEDYAFDSCDSMTAIVIPDSVESIGAGVFNLCGNLTSVVLGSRVKSIGFAAFYQCYKLVEVVNKSPYITITKGKYGNGDIGYYALAVYNSDDVFTGTKVSSNNGYMILTDGDDKLLIGYNGEEADLVFPTYITKINQYALYDCDNLTSVVIPDGVVSIGGHAFGYCNQLTDVEIPDSVESIGEGAFQGCSGLTGVVLGNRVKTIGYNAFEYCSSLTSIVIPDSVTSIDWGAFHSCSSLTSVVLGSSVESIGSGAFDQCYKLVEVVNKSAHITIKKEDLQNGKVGYYALAVYNSDDAFTGTKISNDNGCMVYTDGDEKILVDYKGTETNLSIPTYITKINQYAFYECSTIKRVVISDSVVSIGNYAFQGCDNLTSVVVGDGVVSIGNYAFEECGSLRSAVIGENVESIGYSVFGSCKSLTSVTFDDTSTWYTVYNNSNWINKTGGTLEDVTSPNNNATYFKTLKTQAYWYKL